MDVLAELHDLNTTGGHIGVAAQQIEQADPGIAGETLVDHFQCGHPATDNAVLAGKVVGLDTGFVGFIIGINVAVIHTMEERVNFVL